MLHLGGLEVVDRLHLLLSGALKSVSSLKRRRSVCEDIHLEGGGNRGWKMRGNNPRQDDMLWMLLWFGMI